MEKYECKGLTGHRVDAKEYLILPVSSAPRLEGSLRAAHFDAVYKLCNLSLSALIETVVASEIKANNSIPQLLLAFGGFVANARLDLMQFGQVLLGLRRYEGEAMKGVKEREVTVSTRATLLTQAELNA
jgi:hypothetical protein